MMKRKVEIDRLKGIAILLVVMGHIYCKSIYTVNPYSHPIFNLITLFHMPFFMFLSGVVIANIPSLSKCIVKCFRILLPAILVGSTIAVFTHRSIEGMFFANMKYGYWYLYVLAMFYLILQSFKWVKKRCANVVGGGNDFPIFRDIWSTYVAR